MQLQYAVLDMKRNQRPGGLTGLDGARPCRKQRNRFYSALEKLREFYLDQMVFC